MIKGKILKHRTLPDIYGVPLDGPEGIELCQALTPDLFPDTCTMEGLLKYYEETPANEHLKDYDLVSVELTEIK